jgi:cytidine deaminase
VGAVVIGDDGKEYPGSNIENASYGLTICAERNAIVGAVVRGMKKIK